MCGINGLVALGDSGFRATAAHLVRARDALAHRGPDGHGLWLSADGRVGLGHRRLAIVDRSAAAAQPMVSADGRYVLSYNGEIYNHRALRAELGGAARRWQTDHSDSEVVLHAFAEWGIGCLRRLRGMFAFALWDAQARELWLVRDRLGVKPLYYSVRPGRLEFASEIKALLQDPTLPRAIDEVALFHYLTFLATPPPQTLIRGVRKLAAATWLRVSASGELSEGRYWDPFDDRIALDGASDDELADRVLSELRTSVHLHQESDVPVGVFLSGGVDSSAITSLLAAGRADAVQTFSVGLGEDFPGWPCELAQARQLAAGLGASHHECVLTAQDVLSALSRLVWLQDEPIADPVCVPLLHVASLARAQGAGVCLVGEGADELFIGYRHWLLRAVRQQQTGRLPRLAARSFERALRLSGHDSRAEECGRVGRGVPLYWSSAEAYADVAKRRLLSPAVRRRLGALSSWDPIAPTRARFEERAVRPGPLDWMTYADLHLRLPELLLMRVDKMTMGVGLEARVPFLDHRLVELAVSIPSALRVQGDDLKHVLKRALRGVVPDAVLARPKQGFGLPVDLIWDAHLSELAHRELGWFCEATGLLDPAPVAAALRGHPGRRRWALVNLALWWRGITSGTPSAWAEAS